MADALPLHVILLRAIGPATHKLMGMEQWRDAAAAAGFAAPETLVNTGNMIAGFAGTTAAAEAAMGQVLRGFGLGQNVVPIVRTPDLLRRLVAANPVPEAAAERPSQTAVYFFAAPRPDLGWLHGYKGPERVHVVENHLVVDFLQDAAKSARLIRLIERHCGTGTARNWTSLKRIAARATARQAGH